MIEIIRCLHLNGIFYNIFWEESRRNIPYRLFVRLDDAAAQKQFATACENLGLVHRVETLSLGGVTGPFLVLLKSAEGLLPLLLSGGIRCIDEFLPSQTAPSMLLEFLGQQR